MERTRVVGKIDPVLKYQIDILHKGVDVWIKAKNFEAARDCLYVIDELSRRI